jgi:uncharacterized membrane protein
MASPHPSWPWTIIQIGNVLLAILALWHAWKKGRQLAFSMLAAILFGFIVEFIALRSVPKPYWYRESLGWLPGGVPLGVCISWGLIFVSAFQAASRLTDSPWLRPLIAGFLAVSIDLVLDPCFVFMRFWIWAEPGPWFGIPWSNYAGWFAIVAGLSAGHIWLYRWLPPGQKLWRDLLVALLVLIPAFLCFLGVMKAFIFLSIYVNDALLLSTYYTACAIPIALNLRRFRRDQPLDLIVLATPIYFYACAWISLFLSGLYKPQPALVLIVPITILLGLTGYCWSSLDAVIPTPE